MKRIVSIVAVGLLVGAGIWGYSSSGSGKSTFMNILGCLDTPKHCR